MSDIKLDDDKKVIVYGAEWCGYCHQAMAYFDKKGVAYVYHDIEREPGAAQELMQKLGGPVQGVPVLDVYGEIILGYDLGRINQALAKA
ncbi:NrdH-redoxin [Candidatus Saccharibacteria bacterium]|nr:NrdH-redoxin [Candidatus Saccharibacteria bacterium]